MLFKERKATGFDGAYSLRACLVLGLLAGLDGALQGETLVLLELGLLSLLRDVTLLLRLLDSVTVGLVVLVVVGVVLGLGHFIEVLCVVLEPVVGVVVFFEKLRGGKH